MPLAASCPLALINTTSEFNMIQPLVKHDLPSIKRIIDDNELFPSEMLDDMTSDYLTKPQKECPEIWLTEIKDEKPVSVIFCGPEKMAEGTFNAWLIAVAPSEQGKGYGSRILKYLEDLLRERGERILLIETSGNDEFAKSRAFYEKNGYDQEARIREFYQAGEDKIVYRKAL